MLARLRKTTKENEGGFTLIELLVVMIIIGILAAIAIPAFLSQKNKAKETSAKADVTTIGKELAAYYVDGTSALTLGQSAAGGTWSIYEGPTATGTPVASGKLSTGNSVTGVAAKIVNGDNYCVEVKNADTPAIWRYASSTTAATGLQKGACP